jgi:hypothetical protein
MPGPVLHVGASLSCPHGVPITLIASGPRVVVDGKPAVVLTDAGQIAGCPFMVGNKPQPCVSVKWLAGATRVTAGGQPLLINPAQAICLSADQIPAGPPTVSSTQMKVVAT